MSQVSQTKQVLWHLRKLGAITPLDALKKYGCFRLGARIYDLKQDGHRIDKEMVEVGNGKRVASYTLMMGQGG